MIQGVHAFLIKEVDRPDHQPQIVVIESADLLIVAFYANTILKSCKSCTEKELLIAADLISHDYVFSLSVLNKLLNDPLKEIAFFFPTDKILIAAQQYASLIIFKYSDRI